MADEDDNIPDNIPDPPADPPANPPTERNPVEALEGMVTQLTERVEALSLQVESLAVGENPDRDVTPVSIPWTARGRR